MSELPQTFRPPEEIELERKKEELDALENQLAQDELDLETLRGELAAFEQLYIRVVGVRYAELDRLEAEIAELLARQQPTDKAAAQRAKEARTRAEVTAEAAQRLCAERTLPPFQPSDELKRLYREVAKQVHPDLAEDETERERRHKLMAEANEAYRSGDIDKLRAILREWQCSPEAVKDKGIGGDLVRVIRRISLAQDRFEAIDVEIRQVMETDLYQLWEAAESAREEGRDLLQEMAADLDREVARSSNRLSRVKTEAGVAP